MKRSVLILVALLIPGIHAAGGNPVAADGPVIVEIRKFKFVPREITVKVGTTVRWVNKEKRQFHNVWFKESGGPESESFFPGETYERRFDKPGVYPYVCEPHEKRYDMRGVVRVVE